MAEITTLKGNNNLIIDFFTTPVVLLTCTDNFGNVWSEINVTLMASDRTERGFINLPQISSLYPSNTQINFTIESSLGACTFQPYISNSINGLERQVNLPSNNSTLQFSSGSNNNWFVPALYTDI